MVDKKEKDEPKKAVKKVAAPKAEVKVKKDAAPKKEAAAPATPKEKKTTPSGKSITLTQIGSPIGRQGYQRATLIGLGLNKIRRTSTIIDTPATRGMIERVKHLVKVAE